MAEPKKTAMMDADGKPSAMRQMCRASFWTSIVCATATCASFFIVSDKLLDKAISTGLTLTGLYLLCAVAPKAVQKVIENMAIKKL